MSSCCSEKTKEQIAGFVGVVGSFLVLGGLAWFLVQQNDPGAPDLTRALERKKALTEVRAGEQDALVYRLEDVNKGWVKLPVSRAMEIVADEWKDPAAGREKLLQRYTNSQKQVSFE